MFSLSYVWNELRRRLGRTLLTALGLAAGVGLVMGIIGVSDGLDNAQNRVLSPLSSVGTDIIVTRTVGATTSTATTTTTTPSGGGFTPGGGGGGGGAGGGGFFARGFGGQSAATLNNETTSSESYLSANSTVLTDLAKLGKPGTKYTHDFFVPGTLETFPDAAVSLVAKLPGVTSATGALSLQALHESGTVPTITATFKQSSKTITSEVKEPTATPAQEAAERTCITNLLKKEFGSGTPTAATGPTSFRGSGGSSSSSTFHGRPGGFAAFGTSGAFSQCLTPAQKEFDAKYVVPAETISQVLNPPTTNIQDSSYTVAGVDVSSPNSGLITKAQLVKGSWFTGTGSGQVLLANSYASTKKLAVGGELSVNNKDYKVVGLVNPTLTGDTADVYFALPTLQGLASISGTVNEVLVSVNKASNVSAVAAAIKKEIPGATVLDSQSLADTVKGSLSDAHKIASDFGGALAIVVLIAVFLIAMLLTLSSVAKRTREIGTLRAIGWSRRRVVRQIVFETVGIGVLGAVLGVVLGVAICALIGAIGPGLSVTSSGLAVGQSTVHGALHNANTLTSVLHLTAPVEATTILLGIAGAIVGGLLAGIAGGWRAARLVPATALRDIG